ncbi:TPA: hypothetical protein ACX6PS_003909 [Photobacterium damselae]|uniref:hypothetical protein n=1 Tax=Photobacterium damselae TaxID=38293 RepID=UPI001EDF0566|nr:hypothetical protein [Photobacterium damselae]MCG3847416.1 hypothetical protein [Photobacterium damselae]
MNLTALLCYLLLILNSTVSRAFSTEINIETDTLNRHQLPSPPLAQPTYGLEFLEPNSLDHGYLIDSKLQTFAGDRIWFQVHNYYQQEVIFTELILTEDNHLPEVWGVTLIRQLQQQYSPWLTISSFSQHDAASNVYQAKLILPDPFYSWSLSIH